MNKERSAGIKTSLDVMVALGWHLHTPGKKDSQLRNCLYQISLYTYLRGYFIDC